MKKLAVLAVAAILVFSLAGQAAAFFEDFHLIRSIYDTTKTVEWGSDLGTQPWNLTPGVWTPIGELLNPSDFNGGFNNVKVGYWAADNVNLAKADYWIAGLWPDAVDGLTINSGQGTNLDTATALQNTYNNAPAAPGFAESTVSVARTGTGVKSYWVNMDKTGSNIGSFGGTMSTAFREATQALTGLGTADHYVDMMLYYFDYNTGSAAVEGVEAAIIRTYMTAGPDGDFATLADNKIGTMINPVPIPGSVLLLASGLLGLFGFRRKRS